MYDSRIIRIPTDAASHLVCITVAIIMIAVAALLIFPVSLPVNGIIDIPLQPGWFSSVPAVIINAAATIALVLLISTITNRFGLTNSYSVLPTLFFLLMQCSNPMTGRILQTGTIAAIAVMMCTNILFSNYQKPHVEGAVFRMTLTMAIISLFWYDFALYIPIMWIGMGHMHLLRLKSLLASLVAVAAVAWIYIFAAYSGLLPAPVNLLSDIKNSVTIPDYTHLPASTIFTFISTIPAVILFFAARLSSLYRETQDKISVRNYNMYINTLAFFSFVFMVINPSQIFNYLPIFNCAVAIEAARYFNVIKTKSKLRFLYLIVLTYFALYIIWIL